MLQSLKLRVSYNSEEDDIYQEFYQPVLRNSKTYKRAVGYFSTASLLNTPIALSEIVANDGVVQLIIGQTVTPQDFDLLVAGEVGSIGQDLANSFDDIIAKNRDDLLEYRLRILAWLFAKGRLEVKFAIRPQGLFHTKIGIVADRFGNQVAFNGSANETMAALNPEYNSEHISVYRSWKDGQREYVEDIERRFDRLWSGEVGRKTILCTIPEVVAAGFRLVAERHPEKPSSEGEKQKLKEFLAERIKGPTEPRIPTSVNGKSFGLRDYQSASLKAWADANYQGILALATGAGKTFTAIYAAVKIMQSNEGTVTVITVPYRDLAEQWCREFEPFNIRPIKAWSNYTDWPDELNAYLTRNQGRQAETLVVVVVNATLKSPRFQTFIKAVEQSKVLLIGDECHRHSSTQFAQVFPESIKRRLGLSATPWDDFDTDKNTRLKRIYGDVVYEFTIDDAISSDFLTPYEYRAIPVVLTPEETDDYRDLTRRIGQKIASKDSISQAMRDDLGLKALLMQRARLLSSASGKIPAFRAILQENDGIEPFSLVYCGDGKTIDEADDEEKKQRLAVSSMLKEMDILHSPFTSSETPGQRRNILQRFKDGDTRTLVAIKCLDEGIDVPACRSAYFLASSRNSRQFIQRRGRVLRRAEGKEKAMIYDFVTVLPLGVQPEKSDVALLKNELKRVIDFARSSLNHLGSLKHLEPWIEAYGLDFDIL